MGAVITGMGVVSPLGPDLASLHAGLREGVNACRIEEFPRLDGTVVRAPACRAAEPNAKGLIEPRKLRRMDRLLRMAVVASRQALLHAGLDPGTIAPERAGVVIGTAFGALGTTQQFVDSWISQGERHASPLAFMSSVHGILASQIALDLGWTGVNFTVSQRNLSFEAALDTALGALENGDTDLLLVGGADELTPLLHEFATNLHLACLDTSATGPNPFDPAGPIVPGEGAAIFLLERADTPRRSLVRVEASAMGRLDVPGGDAAAQLGQAAASVDLVSVSALRGMESAAPATLPRLSHAGFFGVSPVLGAMQTVVDVLMLAEGEVFPPLASGRLAPERTAGLSAPKSILHEAHGVGGQHAAFLLSAVKSPPVSP